MITTWLGLAALCGAEAQAHEISERGPLKCNSKSELRYNIP